MARESARASYGSAVDRNSPLPLHYQLKEILLGDMESGRLAPGQQVPTEKELEETYSVSRAVVRQAIDGLVSEGFLYRRQGVGTFVAEPKLEYALGKLTSFTEDIRRRGFKPGSRVLEVGDDSPGLLIRQALELDEGEPVIRLVRLRLSDGKPVGLHTSYFPRAAGLDMASLERELAETPSIYEVIRKKGVLLLEAQETIEAVGADDLESGLLEVEPRAPLIMVRRTTYSTKRLPIEYCKMVYRADRYRYRVLLTT